MGYQAGVAYRKSQITLFVLLALLVTPSLASAATFKGSKADASGDAPSAGLDLRGASASYEDRKGVLSFEFKFRGSPATAQITAGLGVRTPQGQCGAPMLVGAALLPSGTRIWAIERDGTSPLEVVGQATGSTSGSIVKIKGTDSRLKGFKPNCAEVILVDPADTNNVYDSISPFAIKKVPGKPKLKASLGGLGPLKRGAARTVKVKVRNTGQATARGVTVRFSAKGKVSRSPAIRRLGKIAAGKSKTASFRVKANRRGKGKVNLLARASGVKVRANTRGSLRIIVPTPPPPPSKGGLSGKAFWGFESYSYYHSQDPVMLYFVNSRFVHWGFPKGGMKNCTRVTARPKKVEMQPGCLRYSFNKQTGAVRIGKVRGTFRKGNLKLKMDEKVWTTDGKTWSEAKLAKGGSRFKTMLINRGYYGCGVNPYCTTWKENLTLTRDGRFGRQNSSLTTGGGIGTGLPFVGISKLGPDERGRYRILPGGTIRFSYANGKKVTESLVVLTDKRGRPSPVREGLLAGGTWFYPD